MLCRRASFPVVVPALEVYPKDIHSAAAGAGGPSTPSTPQRSRRPLLVLQHAASIFRFLGRLFNMHGSTAEDQLMCEMVRVWQVLPMPQCDWHLCRLRVTSGTANWSCTCVAVLLPYDGRSPSTATSCTGSHTCSSPCTLRCVARTLL